MLPNTGLNPNDDAQWKEYEDLGVDPRLIGALRRNLGGRSVGTLRAYRSDWAQFCTWCVALNVSPDRADAKFVACYLIACATGHQSIGGKPVAIATIERRYTALCWKFAEDGPPLGQTKYLKEVLAGIRSKHIKKKEAEAPPKKPSTQFDAIELPTFRRFTKKRIEKILDLSIKSKTPKSNSARNRENEPTINLSKAIGL
jgi:hypothetical protein